MAATGPDSAEISEDAARGALLGTFVGDALGMPFEGYPSEAIPNRVEMADARLGRGTYTDDTQMMIALAESLIERGEVDSEHLAQRFLEVFDADRGYGGGTLRVFELWRAGASVDEAAARIFGGEGSLGNGAAMRIAPVAARFAHDPERLIAEARRSAQVTHRHPLGVDAAVAQAVATGAALRRVDVLEAAVAASGTDEVGSALLHAGELLAERPGPAELAARVGNSSAGHQSVPAAVYAATAASDFEEAVQFAVRCGGDTDTIGAMAGAIAGAIFGAEAIPRRWIDALEDGERGRSYVEMLGRRLVELQTR